MRIIRADQIRVGDVISQLDSLQRRTVKGISRPEMLDGNLSIETPSVYLFPKDHDEYLLVYRPWPHGKTEADMRNRVARALNVACQAFSKEEGNKRLADLRDTIDDYLMGRNRQ